MNTSIATQQVTLQENGIIRDGKGNYLGRIVEDIDALCEKHYQRGRKSGRAEALEEAAKVCDRTAKDCSLDAYRTIRGCAAAIRGLK